MAGKGIFHTDTEDAEIIGSVFVYSIANEASVEAEKLYWDSRNRILKGDPEDRVRIIRDNGSEISGTGFTGDLKTLTFLFEKSVSGTFIDEED